MGLSFTMASAVASVQRFPDRSTWMRFFEAPPTGPLAIGDPAARTRLLGLTYHSLIQGGTLLYRALGYCSIFSVAP